jgi:hypothetical protein
MTQAVVLSFIDDIEYQDYPAGQVVDFPETVIGFLKRRRLVDTTPAVVAAAIAAGASVITHVAGTPPAQTGGTVARVVVTGTLGTGNVLSASVAQLVADGWSGSPAYQWRRSASAGDLTYANSVAISGATASNYTQVSADEGRKLWCDVSGLKSPVVDAGVVPASVVVGVAPSIVSLPVVTSPPTVGQTVGAQTYTVGTYSGTPTPSTALDSWLLDGSVVSTGYTLAAGDAGKGLAVRLAVSNASGTIYPTAVAVAAAVSGSSGKYWFASMFGGSFFERYNSGTTQTLIASRARHVIGSGDRSKLRVVIPNWAFNTGQNTLAASITRCALECNGVTVPVNFGGSRTVTIPVSSNAATAKFESDDILPAAFGLSSFALGQQVFIRLEASAVPSVNRVIMMYRYDKSASMRAVQYNPTNTSVNIDGTGALTVTGTDFVEWTSGNTTEIAAGLIGPFVGVDRPVWGALGDSIATGDGDGLQADDISGFIQRSMVDADLVSNPVALLKMTVSGYKLSSAVGLINQFSGWFSYASHWFDELGTNDITATAGTVSLATMQSYKATIWNVMRTAGASRIYAMDYLPRTTGTYSSEAGQTVVSVDYNTGGLTDQLSSWFTAKVGDGTLNGKLRFTSPYGTNQYVWPAGGTADGLHPWQSIHIAMAAEMRAWRAGLS